MAYAERRDLITRLEQVRHSRVICYFLADRETFPSIPGFATQLGSEPHLLFVDQLRTIGKPEELDLFLYTRGGATDSVWPLVQVLREHCDKLSVIVPFRAHSGGTMICLGANEIIMTEYAELSPIDPTTGNPFNPADPTNPQSRYGISVEDVVAYFKLAEELAHLDKDPHRVEVFKELTRNVHPLALGNVQRVYMQIRQLGHKLLALHLDEKTEGKRIQEIIKALTQEFYSHLHAISRREATSLLGDWVRAPTDEEHEAIRNLFESYANTLEIRQRFNLPEHMGDEPSATVTPVGGFIDSREHSFVYKTQVRITQRPIFPPNVQVQLPPGGQIPLAGWAARTYDQGIISMGWRANNEGL